MGQAHRALGDFPTGVDEMEKFDLAVYADKAAIHRQYEELRRAYADGGPRAYWLKQRDHGEQKTNLYWQAQATAHLDDYPRSLELLESHYATNKLESLESLLFDECWDPVHTDPRFVALLKLTGLRQ